MYKLGIRKGVVPEGLRTAYLLVDGKCQYNCLYCTHALKSSSSQELLSRVLWIETKLEELLNRLSTKDFSRICLQVVSYPNYQSDLLDILRLMRELGLPISVSVRARTIGEVKEYFELGAERIGIAIDVANEELFKKIRGGSLKELLNLIEQAAQFFPGCISTHLIVGLGETDRELVELIDRMHRIGVAVGLFAFTPVKGTQLENHPLPSIERYRKIQLARWLVLHQRAESIVFEGDWIKGFKDLPVDHESAFLTSGCPDCTRPYYNERPGQRLYNIHADALLSKGHFNRR